MDIGAYRDEIRLKLTGNVLDFELDDSTLDRIINSALREVQRYIDTTKLITVPYSSCINMNQYAKVNSVSGVFRQQGYSIVPEAAQGTDYADPMYLGMWQMLSGNGNLYNLNDWGYSYAAWNTALQTRNTIATDLVFRFERDTGNLYISCGFDRPEFITIEYIPRYDNVSEITSDFWIDIITKLSVALTKQIVGRIRSRYTQTGAIWEQDGDTLLQEANDELTKIREDLKASTQLVYPVD